MAIETLRPNATGDYTNIAGQLPDSGAHWDKVDEATPDELATHLYTDNEVQEKDAFNLEASSIPSGSPINSVRVYFRFATTDAGFPAYCQPFLRLSGNETTGTEVNNNTETFVTHSEILARPSGGSWSIDDLSNLQASIGLRGTDFHEGQLTQVYVEVDYGPLQVPRRQASALSIKLYNRNLSSPTFDSDLTYNVQRLRFSTKLNGGFNLCSFALKAGLPKAWEWLTTKVFYRVVITDKGRTLWEGRIQDLGLSAGLTTITAYGYYASLNDEVYKTAYDANADVVIKAMLTAAAPQINADQTHIDATGGPAISSTAGTDYLDKPIRVLIEKLAKFGDASGNQWYFAIWEDRIPYFFLRSITAVDWTVRLLDLNRFNLRHSSRDLWNKVYAIYGGVDTDDAEDTTSQAKYGDGTNDLVRYYAIQELGAVAEAEANAQRDRWLAEHKDIWPTLEDIALGSTVYDANGRAYPSSWVRAGDVLRILDLVPATGDLDAVVRDALRTFYILETEYDTERLQNRLIVDTENKALTSIIARKL